jgi:16S rRNA (cytidine1402-2'-O)-methyltransferase
MPETPAHPRFGTLYVVSTPIGNLDDITLRAIEVLGRVDRIAAEDTRHTRRLLSAHGIANRLVSYHEHNETRRTGELIELLEQGRSIALVTDAGTPAVSDPGYRLVEGAVRLDIPVVPVPGATAAIAALSVSGLPTDQFTFAGFPDRRKNRRLARLSELARLHHTLIFYQSPKRLIAFLGELLTVMGDRRAVLAREQTKMHEEYLRGPLSEIIDRLERRGGVKGECTILVAGSGAETPDEAEIDAALEEALARQDRPIGEVARAIAGKFGLKRNDVYDRALKIKKKR